MQGGSNGLPHLPPYNRLLPFSCLFPTHSVLQQGPIEYPVFSMARYSNFRFKILIDKKESSEFYIVAGLIILITRIGNAYRYRKPAIDTAMSARRQPLCAIRQETGSKTSGLWLRTELTLRLTLVASISSSLKG